MKNKGIVLELTSLLGLVVAIGLVVLPSASVGATPPISGQTIEFEGAATNVGSHTWWARSVAVGDLDGDGDLDVVSGGYDNKVYAWQNDGAPFSDGTWTQQEVGSHTDWVWSVAVGDLDGDGDLDIVSGADDNKVYAWQNDGTPFNYVWNSQEVGSHADVYSVAVGDLDGDGDLEIVSGGWDYKVNAWQNDGSPFNNTWTSQEVGSHTDYVQSVAVGDLDGDGDLDIVSGGWDYKVNAWENDRTPFNDTWTRQEVGSHTDYPVSSVAVGDLDGDGDLDIISAGDDNRVNAWRNDGSPFAGTWTKQEAGRHPTGLGGVYSVAVGDLDGDDDLDIVSGGSDYKVNAWQNDGAPFNGTWTKQEVGSDTSWVTSVVVGDLDRDGDLDIVSGGADHHVNAWQNAQVHRNAPFGSTAENVGSHTSFLQSVAVGDLDGDADLDIVSGGFDNNVNAWQNDGSPFNDAWTKQEVGSHTACVHSVAMGDLDGDGDLDIVSCGDDYKIYAWQNDGTPFSGTWTQQEVGSHTDGVLSVAVGDLDGDGDPDIVSGGNDNKVNAWQNDGSPFSDGTWTKQEVGSPYSVLSVAAGDLDGDGDLDIVSGGSDNKVNVWQNDGTPFNETWAKQEVGNHTHYVASVAVGDLDGDGDLDIVSGGWDDKVNVWQNDGTPFNDAWNSQEVGSHTDWVHSVAVGDLDGDGNLDIVSGGSDNKVNVWQNAGAPFSDTWNSQEVGSHMSSVYSVAVGDLDGDGDLGIVSGGFDDQVNAWQNQGGSAGLAVSDTSPDTILSGTEDDLLKVVFTHNGVAGDRDLELNTFDLGLLSFDCSTPLTSAEANAIIENLRVRLDDGDETFETDDALVADVEALSLANGVQTVAFTDGDSNVQASAASSKTYWISMLTMADASSQSPNQFCVNFDPDAGTLVEGKRPDPPDFSVSIQDTEPTDTGPVAATGGAIIIENQTDPAGGTGFGFGGDLGTFTLDDDGSQVFSGLDDGDYDVTEDAPTGWDLDSVVCSGGDSTAIEGGVTIYLYSGEEITCTFTNTQRGTIIVEKQTDPDGAAGSFTFTGDAVGAISDGEQIVVSDLAPGTYTATEDDPSPAFDLTAIACDDGNSTGDVGARTATFNLDPGETVKCTFTNTQRGTIIVEKQTGPDGATGSFTFSGDAAGTISDGQQIVVSDLAPGAYTTTEDDPSPAFDLTAITCDDGGSATASTGDVGARTATFNLDPGETVTCTFTNTKQFTFTVDKAGIGTGTVTSDPAGVNCGADCTEDYAWNTVVTLTATPGTNSFFIDWSGDCFGANPITTVTMDTDKTCTATFGYTWRVYLPLITKGAP